MVKEPITRLTWHGRETVEKIAAALNRATRIELDLPANFNHAIFQLLHPGENVSMESLDYTSGPELFDRLALVAGLEELATLSKTLSSAQAVVRIISPPKIIITLPDINRNQ